MRKGQGLGSPRFQNFGRERPLTRQGLWQLGLQKGVPHDLMDGLTTQKLEQLVQNWQVSLHKVSRSLKRMSRSVASCPAWRTARRWHTSTPSNPSHFPGQPILVALPTVGTVPLVLDTPLNKYTWKAKDAYRKEHKINTRWIIPSF